MFDDHDPIHINDAAFLKERDLLIVDIKSKPLAFVKSQESNEWLFANAPDFLSIYPKRSTIEKDEITFIMGLAFDLTQENDIEHISPKHGSKINYKLFPTLVMLNSDMALQAVCILYDRDLPVCINKDLKKLPSSSVVATTSNTTNIDSKSKSVVSESIVKNINIISCKSKKVDNHLEMTEDDTTLSFQDINGSIRPANGDHMNKRYSQSQASVSSLLKYSNIYGYCIYGSPDGFGIMKANHITEGIRSEDLKDISSKNIVYKNMNELRNIYLSPDDIRFIVIDDDGLYVYSLKDVVYGKGELFSRYSYCNSDSEEDGSITEASWISENEFVLLDGASLYLVKCDATRNA